MPKANLKTAPKFFRSDVVRGLKSGATIDVDGGRFNAGLIEGLSIITRGEALGHGLWIDEKFVQSVSKALKSMSEGAKSRFTHPDMSGDGLGKGLGRVVFSGSEVKDIARGDLHLWASSHKSPDGDLGSYVLQRAIEDPESFGISIAFERDFESEKEFFDANVKEIEVEDERGGKWLESRFISPDVLNTNNLPHARLAELRAVDAVDDPAANPRGLFHRDEIFKEAESLLEYAIGLKDHKPEVASFDVDPDRVGGFVRRFFKSRGLEIMKLKSLNDTNPEVENDPAKPATDPATIPATAGEPAAVPAAVPAADPATPVEDPAKPKEEPKDELSAGRKEAARFAAAFGDRGFKWFAEGKTFEQAQELFAKDLSAENERLKKQLSAAQNCEPNPLSNGGADDKRGGSKSGFASKIRIPSLTPSNN